MTSAFKVGRPLWWIKLNKEAKDEDTIVIFWTPALSCPSCKFNERHWGESEYFAWHTTC